jgi:hypothetical protein
MRDHKRDIWTTTAGAENNAPTLKSGYKYSDTFKPSPWNVTPAPKKKSTNPIKRPSWFLDKDSTAESSWASKEIVASYLSEVAGIPPRQTYIKEFNETQEHYMCFGCGRYSDIGCMEIEHILPFNSFSRQCHTQEQLEVDYHNLFNLGFLCGRCNRSKGAGFLLTWWKKGGLGIRRDNMPLQILRYILTVTNIANFEQEVENGTIDLRKTLKSTGALSHFVYQGWRMAKLNDRDLTMQAATEILNTHLNTPEARAYSDQINIDAYLGNLREEQQRIDDCKNELQTMNPVQQQASIKRWVEEDRARQSKAIEENMNRLAGKTDALCGALRSMDDRLHPKKAMTMAYSAVQDADKLEFNERQFEEVQGLFYVEQQQQQFQQQQPFQQQPFQQPFQQQPQQDLDEDDGIQKNMETND